MLKKILLATMFMGVLSASALSMRQLRTGTHALPACGAFCKTDCQFPCHCIPISGRPFGFCS